MFLFLYKMYDFINVFSDLWKQNYVSAFLEFSGFTRQHNSSVKPIIDVFEVGWHIIGLI